ncbi:MAG: hypothetical protein JSR17_06690 [Proteobacteria bacterium]|nr:hypothetical protein [Pseudomonadota bacterium]
MSGSGPQQELDATLASIKAAKQALEEVPSHVVPIIKEVAVAGAGVFRIFNGLDAIYNIYKIYKEGNTGTLGDKALRGLRVVGNLGIIALSGVAAAVAFGATVVAAPVFGAVLGGITVVKNSFDLAAEYRKSNKIKIDIEKREKELNEQDIHVAQNIELLSDLGERQAKIEGLKQEEQALSNIKKKFAKATPDEKSKLVQNRVAELEKSIIGNEAIDSFVKANQSKLNDIPFLNKSLDELQKKREALKIQLAPLLVNEQANKDKIDPLTKELVQVEASIGFVTKVRDLQEKVNEVNLSIAQVNNKYNKPPLNKLPTKEKTRLIEMEMTFLGERKIDFEKKLGELKSPESRKDENKKAQTELEHYQKSDPEKHSEIFEQHLQSRLDSATEQRKENESSLKERKKFTELFLGPKFLEKPRVEIEKRLDDNFDKTLQRAKLESDLKKSKIERNKKWKNIGLGLLGFGIAVAACIPPAQALIGVGLVVVGIVAGANAIYDYKKKKDAEKQAKQQEKEITSAYQNNKVRVLTNVDGLTAQHTVSVELQGKLDGMLSSSTPDTRDHGALAIDGHDSTRAVTSARKVSDSSQQPFRKPEDEQPKETRSKSVMNK